jgi:hypothetical protein
MKMGDLASKGLALLFIVAEMAGGKRLRGKVTHANYFDLLEG